MTEASTTNPPGFEMTLDEAQDLLLGRAADEPGDNVPSVFERLAQGRRPCLARFYREGVEIARNEGDDRLAAAIRRLARWDLAILRDRGKGLGREAWEIRAAAGLPTETEDHAAHGTFFPKPFAPAQRRRFRQLAAQARRARVAR